MSNAIYKIPTPVNEPTNAYPPGCPKRASLLSQYEYMKSSKIDIPQVINGEEIFTQDKHEIRPPHDLSKVIGTWSKGDVSHVNYAIESALLAKKDWEEMAWQDRAAIFLKAADLISTKYRDEINAATMLCQSKNVMQAEVDAVAELADFWRFNVYFMSQIYEQQPISIRGQWNQCEYRPLEGFVFAITPFNFTAIAGNLPTAPAMLGNTVVWKPAESQIYSTHVIMKVLRESGLPPGVINLILTDGPVAGDIIFKHPKFAGLHFTGSTGVFKSLWKEIGNNIDKYEAYPRVVGETGGKDFVLAHHTADPKQVATALARGAFEYQGQKCSAASRAYIPRSLWNDVKKYLIDDVKSFKIGDTGDPSNFINAVIDERAFDKISGYIDKAKASSDAEILVGGDYDKSSGYFIKPTVIQATDPHFVTMVEEIFGPVLTCYVYDDHDFDKMLELVDGTSEYALTGAVFAKPRSVINYASRALKHSAGNFYINDKPTGSIVGQQPFGGARGSGTNDKAGSIFNLLRWVSVRSIKENFNPPTDYRYPFLGED